jgi:hypothetical protein
LTTHRFDELLFDSDDAAIQALRDVGATFDEHLTMEVDYVPYGSIMRFFAYFGNISQLTNVANPVIVSRMTKLVQDPENWQIFEKLKSGDLSYTPFNKRSARAVSEDLDPKVHLPWAYKMMNFDMGLVISKVHKSDEYPFSVFYSQHIQPTEKDDGVEVTAGRIFSLPIVGNVGGTWHEMMVAELLDEDIALILETNSRL